MSSTPEQLLWSRMRTGLPQGAEQNELKLQRIEQMLEDGMPDVMAIRQARVTMIELKAAPRPVRGTTIWLGRKGMRTDQRNWILDWRNHGGRAIIVAADTVHLIHIALDGIYADDINNMSYTEACEKAFIVGEGRAFWNDLRLSL